MSTDVRDSATWERIPDDSVRALVCPGCVVVVPASLADLHIERRHPVQRPEAIVHLTTGNVDRILDGYLRAPYREQVAALHAREHWDPVEVERCLGAIYQYTQTGGTMAILESTRDLLHHAALEWHSTDGSPV